MRGELNTMKQTKKLTRGHREFLERKYHIDTKGVRLVGESKDNLTVQMADKSIRCFSKEV